MIPLPKPRGFWDYALFALIMTAVLSFLFWLEASDGIGWADGAFAFAAAVLFVFNVILARRGEKAKWIKKPTWRVYLAAGLGAFTLTFGAIYADAYLLHRRDITARRFWNDVVLAILLTAGTLCREGDLIHGVRCCNRAIALLSICTDDGRKAQSGDMRIIANVALQCSW